MDSKVSDEIVVAAPALPGRAGRPKPATPALRGVVPADPALLSRAWSALFGAGAAEARVLDAIARVRRVDAGEAVFSRQERAQAAVLLVEGDVALGLKLADSSFEVERIVHAPAWLDLGSVWLAATHSIDAQANGAAVIVELPREPLKQLLERNPALSMRVIQGLAREHQAMVTHTQGLMHLAAPARLAQWLRQNAKPAATPPGQAVVRLAERKRDLAAQLAIAPETLSRLLRSFTRQGVIDVAGYTVHVLDRAALDRMAQI